jgi:hypothetical protein
MSFPLSPYNGQTYDSPNGTRYVYRTAGYFWDKVGSTAAGSGNAVMLQGYGILADPPSDGQVLIWNEYLGAWSPGATVGIGDVIGPATHSASYVPQWNLTANSRTLVEGFPITTAGKSLVAGVDASAQRTTLGLGNSAVLNTGTSAGTVALGDHLHASVYQPLDAELTALAGLVSAADRLPYFTGSGTAALATFTAAGRSLVSGVDAAAQRTTLGLGTSAVLDTGTTGSTVALGNHLHAGVYIGGTSGTTDNRVVRADGTGGYTVQAGVDVSIDDSGNLGIGLSGTMDRALQLGAGKAARGTLSTLTDGATITMDLALGNFFTVTLGGARTLANPSSMQPGQSGCTFIVQDSGGSKTLAYGPYWKFAGAVPPVLSTSANTVDRLDWVVFSTTAVHGVLTKALA